jgi:hypothetical protein
LGFPAEEVSRGGGFPRRRFPADFRRKIPQKNADIIRYNSALILREFSPSASICGIFLRKSAGNPFCGNLRETPSAEICRKPLLRKSAGNPFCGNLQETPSAEICGKPLLRKSAGNPLCGNLQETPSAEICRKPLLRKSAGNLLCGNLVRHEACVKYTTYVDARTTRAKMPISLKEVRLIWRKRKIKSSH